MKRWALMRGGCVTLVVEQEAQPTVLEQWLDITGLHVGPGFTTPDNGVTWVAPAEPV